VVALKTNSGRFFEVWIDDLAARAPTRVELLDPVPATGAYGDEISVRALLTADGQPLEGQRVVVRIGTSRASALTGPDGIATALVALATRPANYLLQADFQGDRSFAPSADAAAFTVVKQPTVLTFQPLPSEPAGPDVIVALADANGKPLKERTVFFIVDYGAFKAGSAVITDFAGRADLSELPLPPGEATVTAFFNGTIPVPDAEPVTLNDDLYLPAVASISLTFVEPPAQDEIAFATRQVDVHYKSTGRGRSATVPVYTSASVHGDLAFAVPLHQRQLLADTDTREIHATVEAYLAGEQIASATVQLDVRGNFGRHWTSGRRPGEEVAYVGIHWADAPRFDSSLSTGAGPRISTRFIGDGFSEIAYQPVAGSYQTVFPDGTVIAVRKGAIDLSRSSGLVPGDFELDGGTLVMVVNYAVLPGMKFTTRASPGGSLIAAVTVTDGLNHLREGGRMVIRLKAVAGTPRPQSDASPNRFEFRCVLGAGPGETPAACSARVGEGDGAVPWSSESPILKQYRP
jgi:hypothetical protein